MENHVADQIRFYRRQEGLTQEQLAEAMGVSVAAVSKWEQGIFSHVREYPPWTPKRTRGEGPSIPDIGSLQLKELHALRNRVRRTWLRHEPLLFATTCNRALLS